MLRLADDLCRHIAAMPILSSVVGNLAEPNLGVVTPIFKCLISLPLLVQEGVRGACSFLCPFHFIRFA